MAQMIRRWMFGMLAGFWLVCCSGPVSAWAAEIDHAVWNDLLHRFVKDGQIDYEGMAQEEARLKQYLEQVREARPETWATSEAQLAFWINAYNACAVFGVLDHAYVWLIPVKSVKEIKGFFDQIRYSVGGRSLTLNQIEAEGRKLGDWRVHFGMVCASSSCPPIRNEAYDAKHLRQRLTDQVRRFLQDPGRGLRLDGATLQVSKIFDWYAGDFVPGQGGLFRKITPAQLLPVLKPYLAPDVAEAIAQRARTVAYLEYDWSLNRRPSASR